MEEVVVGWSTVEAAAVHLTVEEVPVVPTPAVDQLHFGIRHKRRIRMLRRRNSHRKQHNCLRRQRWPHHSHQLLGRYSFHTHCYPGNLLLAHGIHPDRRTHRLGTRRRGGLVDHLGCSTELLPEADPT